MSEEGIKELISLADKGPIRRAKIVYHGTSHFTICDGGNPHVDICYQKTVGEGGYWPDKPLFGEWHCENCGKKENCKCSYCASDPR